MAIVLPLPTTTLSITGFPGASMGFSDVQPFSQRSAATYNEQVEQIRAWIEYTLVPYLTETVPETETAWRAAVDAALAQQSTNVNASLEAAIQAVVNATVTVTDPIVRTLLDDATSQVRTFLDARYAPVQVHAQRNAITGWWHVSDFGAIGDGSTHDSAPIQAAIDAANAAYLVTAVQQRVFFPSNVYLCEALVTQNPVSALMLKSGVELYGDAVLRVAPGSYWTGTDYGLLRSPDEGTDNTAIVNLSFDGNTNAIQVPGGNTQASNIVLRTSRNLRIQNVKSYATPGMGIMVAGHSNNLSKSVVIEGCQVTSCGNIGIQASQFDGLKIINNEVAWTHDNGIDIYGEPESHNGADGSKGTNFEISGNHVHDCGNGIFPETVAKGVIQNNNIRNVGEGIHVNRINAEPNNILISGNYIYGAQSAVRLTGDTGGVTIQGNVFEWFNTAGVDLGGAGRVSQYYILDNTMNGNADTVPLVLIRAGTDQTARIVHLRTMTRSLNRAYDTVNSGPAAVGSTWLPALSPGDTPA